MSDTIPVLDKFTGEIIGRVPLTSPKAVDDTIASAAHAFDSFSKMPTHVRSKILLRVVVLLERDADEIATTICREAGKAWKYSTAEVDRAVETFSFSAEEAKRIHGETVPMDASAFGEGRFGFYTRVPVGVVAAITPFNFPLNLVAHKVGPAIAAGNTVVLKPVSTTPMTALKLVQIFQEAGLPDGALKVLVGSGARIGNLLVADKRVAKISFTGSAVVGEAIMKCAGIKKVTLELGNNSATIVEPDADIDKAVVRCCMSAFANAGQVCLSLQRLYLHHSIAARFTEKLVAGAKALKVGNPIDKECDVGPMISEEEAARALAWVDEAVSAGAKLLCGGKRKGSLFEPAVLIGVRPEMKVVCKELFAPVVSIIRYDDFEDALRQMDDTEYGLQAGIYTQDLSKALRAVEKINAGGIMINDTSIFRADHMPYGGNKMSGIGREGVKYAIEEMTNIKMVVIRS